MRLSLQESCKGEEERRERDGDYTEKRTEQTPEKRGSRIYLSVFPPCGCGNRHREGVALKGT